MSSSSLASSSTTLLSGEEGRAQAAQLLAHSPLCSVATFPEYTVETAKEGRPHEPEPLQLLAISNGETHCVLDVRRTPALATVWPKDKAVAAVDGQRLQHALWRANAGEPLRWASFVVMAQLLAAPLPVETDAPSLARDVGRMTPLPDASTLEGLCHRADAFVELAWAQAEALRGEELASVARLEAAAVTPTAALERNGLPFDASHLSALLQQERQWLSAAASQTDERKAKQLRHLQQTAGDTLLAAVQANGRLHASFQQIGASSGRMATRSPNIQGLTKLGDRRACVRAPKGYALVLADYAACELRILAHLSQDRAYRDAFASGEDVHKTIAARLFRKASQRDVTERERQAAKAVSFGLVYGMHAKGLASRLQCSVSEAQNHIDSFFHMYPAIRSYLEQSAKRDLRRASVRTLAGRRIRLLEDDASRNERLARNLPIQGSGADILKTALRQFYTKFPGQQEVQLVHAVHDSVIVLAKAEDTPEIKRILAQAMHDAAYHWAPDVQWQVDAAIATQWS